jgi:hypothetical protein
VGDHPDAEDARKLARYYDDLLQEIEFLVRVDGEATVGHTGPFGVFVTLRHTADIEREAGGFARYLRNLKKTSYPITTLTASSSAISSRTSTNRCAKSRGQARCEIHHVPG